MVYGQGLGVEEAVELNRLRRSAERWTDLLLGHLIGDFDVAEFAFTPDRATDFARDLRDEQRVCGSLAWQLVLSSMRASFQSGLSPSCHNADLNTKIAAGVLRCFDAQLFDSTGMAKSLWMVRLENKANDTQGMIDDLLTEDLNLTEPAIRTDTAPRNAKRFS